MFRLNANKRLERDAVNVCGAKAVQFIGRAPQAKRSVGSKWENTLGAKVYYGVGDYQI